eukprot:gene11493-4657_t
MRHLYKKGRTLGRGWSHRKALLRNLTTQLIKYGKIKTTLTRAKELRREADKMVTISKNAFDKECNHHEKIQLLKWIYESEIVEKALKVFPVQFEGRKGGYTRIIPLIKRRKGDGSKMCYIEYLDTEKADNIIKNLKENGN